MTKAGAIKALFERFDALLRGAGYIAMSGQIVESSLIAVLKQRNTKEEKHDIKAGRIPQDWTDKPAKLRQKDRDARWTVNFTKAKPQADRTMPPVDIAIPAFGYHNYISIDREHGLSRKWRATDTAAYEGTRLREGLLDRTNTSKSVWADTAYRSNANDKTSGTGCRSRAAAQSQAGAGPVRRRNAAWHDQLAPRRLAVGERPEWLVGLTQHLLTWATEANAPDEDGRDADGRPFTFNASFFDYLGILSAALPHEGAVALLIQPMTGLPDEAFFDTMASLVRGFNRAVNSTDATKPSDLFALRRVVGPRLQQADGYTRLAWRKSFSCEMYLGDALCAIFYQAHRGFSLGPPPPPRPPSNFVPAMPMPTALVSGASTSGYVAVLFLDLVEIAPSAELSAFVLEAVRAWVKTYGDDTSFWNNNDIGSRICAGFTEVFMDGDLGLTDAQQTDLRVVLARAGVTSARTLEDLIDTMNNPRGQSPRAGA